jgi:mannosyl-glycoprotein endo-beta-N-acetylglucosaminidase
MNLSQRLKERAPRAYAYGSLDEFQDKFKEKDPFLITLLPSPSLKQQCSKRKTKLLVCHDMMGGYNVKEGDHYVQGNFKHVSEDIYPCYTFNYFAMADIFVYFSHHRVTIPPPAWIQAAHRQGCKIYGTFITEGEDGMLDNDKLVSGTDRGNDWIALLAELSVAYKIDGWLLNIETPFTDASSVPLFLEWIRKFSSVMSDLGKGVMWYDALTNDNKILWQNALNGLNVDFYNAATDGIFLNYGWRSKDLETSLNHASDDKGPVWVGIDVWGRSSQLGGGGFNTHIALQEIENNSTDKSNLGVAVFAPAWTYEGHCKTAYEKRDLRLWTGIGPENPQEGVCKYIPSYAYFPGYFYSDFNRGFGKVLKSSGSLLKRSSWFHIGLQNQQPQHIVDSDIMFEWKITDEEECVYNGGSGLKIKKKIQSLNVPMGRHCVPLFKFCNEKMQDLMILKAVGKSVSCETGVYISFSDGNEDSTLFCDAILYNDWNSAELHLEGDCMVLKEIGVYIDVDSKSDFTSNSLGGVIGCISLVPQSSSVSRVKITNVRCSDLVVHEKKLLFTLHWDHEIQEGLPIDNFVISEQSFGFVGLSLCNVFRCDSLPSHSGKSYTLKITPVDAAGRILAPATYLFKPNETASYYSTFPGCMSIKPRRTDRKWRRCVILIFLMLLIYCKLISLSKISLLL